MHRMDPASTSLRSYSSGGARSVVKVADDDHNMQELSGEFMKGESRKRIERPQNYGFTSSLLPADKDGKKGPEAIISFVGGDRSHPIASVVDDRRHRPYGLEPGENAQYDDQGQMTLLARDGAYVMSTKGQASLRHVEKQTQPRKEKSEGSASSSEKYDHKGTVNAEVSVKKDKIEAKIGSSVLWVVKDGKVYLGGDGSSGTYAKVMTESGPSSNVYAKI